MKTVEKIISDDHFVNRLLLNIANSGESNGSKIKTWLRNNWIITSSIVTICIMAPIYFIWGFNKSRTNNF